VRVLAHVAPSAARPLLELRARHAAVVVLARIPPPRVLAGVDKGALGPVVGVGPRASAHLEGVHAEVVGGVGAVLDVGEGGVRRPLLAGAEEREEVVLEGERVGGQGDEVGRAAVEVVEEGGVGGSGKETGDGGGSRGRAAGRGEVERGGEGRWGGAIGVRQVGQREEDVDAGHGPVRSGDHERRPGLRAARRGVPRRGLVGEGRMRGQETPKPRRVVVRRELEEPRGDSRRVRGLRHGRRRAIGEGVRRNGGAGTGGEEWEGDFGFLTKLLGFGWGWVFGELCPFHSCALWAK
jgi:hypothetical protein